MKIVIRKKRKTEMYKYPLGERFKIPREGKKSVDVLLYRPKDDATALPVLFNIHGGAWVGCDASQMDSFCLEMAEKCNAFIVNINYTKLDIKPFPYPQEEIYDTVLYFKKNAQLYGVDPAKFALIGFSAGGHLAAATTLILKDRGVDVSAQVLCYPFLDFTNLGDLVGKSGAIMDEFFFPNGISKTDPYVSPGLADENILKGIAPAIFVVCGNDPLTEQARAYQKKLELAYVQVNFQLYDKALHGFLEVNHKEYPDQEAKNPEQEKMAKEAEDYIVARLQYFWNDKR